MGKNHSTPRRVDKNYLYGLPVHSSVDTADASSDSFEKPRPSLNSKPALIEESSPSPQMSPGLASPRRHPLANAARDAREPPSRPRKPVKARSVDSPVSPPPYRSPRSSEEVPDQDKYATRRVRPSPVSPEPAKAPHRPPPPRRKKTQETPPPEYISAASNPLSQAPPKKQASLTKRRRTPRQKSKEPPDDDDAIAEVDFPPAAAAAAAVPLRATRRRRVKAKDDKNSLLARRHPGRRGSSSEEEDRRREQQRQIDRDTRQMLLEGESRKLNTQMRGLDLRKAEMAAAGMMAMRHDHSDDEVNMDNRKRPTRRDSHSSASSRSSSAHGHSGHDDHGHDHGSHSDASEEHFFGSDQEGHAERPFFGGATSEYADIDAGGGGGPGPDELEARKELEQLEEKQRLLELQRLRRLPAGLAEMSFGSNPGALAMARTSPV